ncbi:MAG: LamG-like jellyroll fold domain-containing protein [Chitinophagaceae bacterium]
MKRFAFLLIIQFAVLTTHTYCQIPVTTNLQLWLKADAGITKDGAGNISAWADQSPNLHLASQSIPTSQPLWVANVLNGKPVVRFDGANDLMTTDVNGPGGTEFTFFVVAKSDGQRILSYNDGNGYVLYSYAITNQFVISNDGGPYGGLNPAINDPSYFVAGCARYKASTSNGMQTFLNGSLVAQRDAENIAALPNAPLQIGGAPGGTTEVINGDVAEIIVYNRALTDAEKSLVDNYLSVKYGLVPPDNNNCSSAQQLTPSPVGNAGCSNPVSGTTHYATDSDTLDCNGLHSVDVWYKFIATQPFHKVVVRNANPAYLMAVQFFNTNNPGAACSNLVSMGCIYNNASGDSTVYKAYHLTPGATYFVRVYTQDGYTGRTDFDICISSPGAISPPVNDSCQNAGALTPSPNAGYATAVSGTCAGATPSVRDCYGRQSNDVWYKFQANNTHHKIVVKGQEFVEHGGLFEYYPDGCTTNPYTGQCVYNASGDSLVYKMSNLVPGNWYYIKVGTNAEPVADCEFTICITTPDVPANDLCSGAIALPTYATWHPTAGSTVQATGDFYSYDCNSSRVNDVWYKFVATDPAHKILLKNQDFVERSGAIQFFDGNCNSLNSIGCSGQYQGDSTFYEATGLTIGNTYYFRVYTQYYSNYEGSFDIGVTGGPDPLQSGFNNCVVMNGIDDYIQVGDMGNTPMQGTISMRLKYNGSPLTFSNPLTTNFAGQNANGFRLEASSGLVLVAGDVGGLYDVHTFLPALTAGVWYKIDFVYDQTTNNVKGYVDSNLVFDETNTHWPSTFPDVRIGEGCDDTRRWNGKIDEVSFWDVALTKSQLDANSTTELSGAETALKAYYNMNRSGSGKDSVVINNAMATAGAYDGITRGTNTTPVFTHEVPVVDPCLGAVSTLYVDAAVTQSGNGSSPAQAFKTLSEALYIANHCTIVDSILVAEGTYRPCNDDGSITSSRDSSFRILRNGIKLLGGYLPYNFTNDARYGISILSGDIGIVDNNGDNCFHVLTMLPANDITTATVLDGFTIQGGNTDGGSSFLGMDGTAGGGIYLLGYPFTCNPLISNCIIRENSADGSRGGGMMLDGIGRSGTTATCNPTIKKCRFENNNSFYGAGVCIVGYNSNGHSNAAFTDCIFKNNSGFSNGGGVYIQSAGGECSNTFLNCTFSSNSSEYAGGAAGIDLSNTGASVQNWINCVFVNNYVSAFGGSTINPGAIYLKTEAGGGQVNIKNSSFSGNKTRNNLRENVIQFDGSVPQPVALVNCIFGDDKIENDPSKFAISYSLINQPAFAGNNNIISANTGFVNAADPDGADNNFQTADDGLALANNSLALDKGNNAAVADANDILHRARPFGIAVDMGAYESYDEPVYTGPCPANHVLYVDSSKATSGSGISWATAYKTLSEALYAANACTNVDSILVAKGTYCPVNYDGSFSNSRFNFFRVFRKMKLYGGYPSGGGLRNVFDNPTILSGDLDKNDNGFSNMENNAYHIMIVYPDSLVANAITPQNTAIDGFTFKGGNANRPLGDGVFNRIRGREIVYVLGGAIYNKAVYPGYAESSPLINNCVFVNNIGTNGGGAMYNACSQGVTSPVITNSKFFQNKGLPGALGGGAIFLDAYSFPATNFDITLHLGNSVFEDNMANDGGLGLGGAVATYYGGNIIADNTVFSQNKSREGAAVFTHLFGPAKLSTFNNCLFNQNMASDLGSVFSGLKGNFTNCTFNQNSPATAGYEIFGHGQNGSDASKIYNIYNCIFNGDIIYDNGDGPFTAKYNVRNSLISQPAFNILSNNNIISSNPQFTDIVNGLKGADGILGNADDGLQLMAASPCLDAGANSVVASGFPDKDLLGNDRVINGTIDMGCYEYGDPAVCPGSTTSFTSNITGATYQWQVNSGSGFTNLTNTNPYTGVSTSTLAINNVPAIINGNQYRCVVNGISNSRIYTIRISESWGGSMSDAWEIPANWNCGVVPDENTDVVVNGNMPNYPRVNTNITIRSLRVNPGATVTVTAGHTLTVKK